jgi:hypothetical protein
LCVIDPSMRSVIVVAGGSLRTPRSTVRGAGTTVCSVK